MFNFYFSFFSFFLLGAVIGSFLNVVVYRLPLGKSLNSPPSSCPSCGGRIKYYDNVPIFAWLWLGGKCRACKASVSFRYPMVELGTALLFTTIFWRLGLTAEAGGMCLLAAILIAVALIDYDHMIIPNQLTVFGMVGGVVTSVLVQGGSPLMSLAGIFAGVFGTMLFGWGFETIFKKEGMGVGDMKLMGVFGAFFGPGALIPIIVTGAILALVMIPFNIKKTEQGEFPFGPALATAALLNIFVNLQDLSIALLRH